MSFFSPNRLKKPIVATAIGLGMLAAALSSGTASADEQKITFALPGVPPIFGSIFAYVAKEEGIYKKYGLDVDLRPMNSGVGAARAVVARRCRCFHVANPAGRGDGVERRRAAESRQRHGNQRLDAGLDGSRSEYVRER